MLFLCKIGCDSLGRELRFGFQNFHGDRFRFLFRDPGLVVNSLLAWDPLLVVEIAAVLDERSFLLREVGDAFLLRGDELLLGALDALAQHFF